MIWKFEVRKLGIHQLLHFSDGAEKFEQASRKPDRWHSAKDHRKTSDINHKGPFRIHPPDIVTIRKIGAQLKEYVDMVSS